jgi:endonuclease/exonuclease/phosphatase family metal-dependent hydrolase
LEQRGLLHCEVSVDGRLIHVLVVHLGLIPASRLRQVAQLKRFIEREVPHDAPLIIAGDFNDWGDRVRHLLEGIHMKACQPAVHATYPARLPLVQLDYVYARGLQPLSVHVPRGRAWWRMSDHLPLIADFQLPE